MESGGVAPEIPTDVLLYLFHILVDVDVECLWSTIPLVCKQWARARAMPAVKTRMVNVIFPHQSVSWTKQECVYFFDSVCRYFSLREPFRLAVATTVAHGRLRGVPWPDLSDVASLCEHKEWHTLFWKTHQKEGYFHHLSEFRTIYDNGIRWVSTNIERLKACCTLMMNPPMPAYLDEVQLPMLNLSTCDCHECEDYRLNWYPDHPVLLKLYTLRQQLGAMVANVMQLPNAPKLPVELLHVDSSDCVSCNFSIKLTKGAVQVFPADKLCKTCMRLKTQLFGIGGDLTRIDVWISDRQSLMLTNKNRKQIIQLNVFDVWWPDIELDCQRACAQLVDPECGVMQLSSSGLRCLLDDAECGGILTTEFLQQTHMAHALALEQTAAAAHQEYNYDIDLEGSSEADVEADVEAEDNEMDLEGSITESREQQHSQ